MQIVAVNGREYLADDIKTIKDQTIITGAMEIGNGGGLTAGVIGTYLKKANLNDLQTMALNGAQSFQTQELTAMEEISWSNQTALFKLSVEVAMPRLQNSTFDEVSAGM